MLHFCYTLLHIASDAQCVTTVYYLTLATGGASDCSERTGRLLGADWQTARSGLGDCSERTIEALRADYRTTRRRNGMVLGAKRCRRHLTMAASRFNGWLPLSGPSRASCNVFSGLFPFYSVSRCLTSPRCDFSLQPFAKKQGKVWRYRGKSVTLHP